MEIICWVLLVLDKIALLENYRLHSCTASGLNIFYNKLSLQFFFQQNLHLDPTQHTLIRL